MIGTDKPPYPGLRPFERDESHLFFGRDDCVDEMIARLAERRFLAVLGSSGTGKSSLVKTGLFCGLEMGLLSGAGSQWLIVAFQPGGNPVGNLARGLLAAESAATARPLAPDASEVSLLQARFKREGPRELIKWCGEGHLPDDTNLLVLVDQFEELFRYQNDAEREDAQALVSLLLESRWPRGVATPRAAAVPIYVAITMRSEYLGACALVQGLAEAINEGTFLTPRMKREECEEAIVGPARVCGLEVEPRLVTRLLNDMADFAPWDEEGSKDQLSRLARQADQLPLMQHALNQMWQRARPLQKVGGEQIILKLSDYRGLEQELDDHAEQVLGTLDETARPIAEMVFRAVTLGTTVANAVRRPTTYGNLINICGPENRAAVAQVIAAFGPRGCQFLNSDTRQTGEELPDRAWIDISHESLIRQWGRLSRWLREEGQTAHEWQQLDDEAKKYWTADLDHPGFALRLWRRVSGYLLLSGWRLRSAIALRTKSHPTDVWAERYGVEPKQVNRFLDRSVYMRGARWGLFASCAAVVVAALVTTTWRAEQAKQLAEEKALEASLAARDLAAEIRSSNAALLSGYQTIADLAETLRDRSSPLGSLYALNRRSSALSKMGNHEGAIAELDAILTIDPNNVTALGSRTFEYLNVGRASDAIKDIDKILGPAAGATTYNNLAIARAMLRDYDAAIIAAKTAVARYQPPSTTYDTEVSPDIKVATGHSIINLDNYDFRVALGYLVVLCQAFKGGEGFEQALKEADDADYTKRAIADVGLSRSNAMNSYLAALNWGWLSSVWQSPGHEGIQDYGLHAAEGALWERVAAIQPRYFDWARRAYLKFQKAYGEHPEARYDALSRWVTARLARKEISVLASSPLRVSEFQQPEEDRRTLILRAQEQKANRANTSVLSMAEPHRLISIAIAKLERERAETGAKRPDLTDELVALLLNRADWRLDAGDLIGARQDARRILDGLNPNVSMAYRLLAKTDVDDLVRKEHYEKALEVDPANATALWELATLLTDTDPQRALELQERRLKFVNLKSEGYEAIGKLQLKLGRPEVALRSVAAAISITPFRTRLFELRRDIEVALNRDKNRISAQFAAGYRRAGDYSATNGDQAEALSTYLRGLDILGGITTDDEAARFELETTIRTLSEFISSHYSKQDTRQFWESLAKAGITKNYRAKVQQEIRRLAIEN